MDCHLTSNLFTDLYHLLDLFFNRRFIFKKSANLFKGMRFYFGSNDSNQIKNSWEPVLFAAQALIVDDFTVNNSTGTNSNSK